MKKTVLSYKDLMVLMYMSAGLLLPLLLAAAMTKLMDSCTKNFV